MAIHWGKKHDYLGMEVDFSKKGKVKISMTKYVESMLEDFPEKLKSTDTVSTPASMAYSIKAKERNLTKSMQIDIIRWLQKHYFYVSMLDQRYSLLLLYCVRGLRAQMKPTGRN